ncbi:MAG: hypothetical protein F6J97_00090 [Leptolyngbya sp. SIO4C1]|nr:hypothetical protein [Leptolyngbya sp. SIO4C1]
MALLVGHGLGSVAARDHTPCWVGQQLIIAKQAPAERWQPDSDRGTATSTLSGGRRSHVSKR